MEQLIFVGIIVLFSVLEAVARKGRARQGGGEDVPLPEEPHQRRPQPRPRPAAEPHAGTVPRSYDEDRSFDEVTHDDETRRRPEAVTLEVPAPPARRSSSSSEGLIPADVWDEIQRMARGEAPPKEREPVPAPPVPAPVPSRPRPTGQATPSRRAGAPTAQPRTGKETGRPLPRAVHGAPATEGTAGHPVHLSHQDYGTAPAHRAGAPLAGAGRPAPAPAVGLRALLGSGPASLRQAIVLQDLLGPPPGLRDD